MWLNQIMNQDLTPAAIAARIDHTLLKPEADDAAIDAVCAEALEHHFASVCVNGRFVPRVASVLAKSAVKTCSVVGFPLGAMSAAMKAAEARAACDDGADEIDFVASLPMLMQGKRDALIEEWTQIVAAAKRSNQQVVVKAILETAALMADVDDATAEERIALAADVAREAGVAFIKTSTGFHPAGGATVAAVQRMRELGKGLQVKASGGIRTREDAVTMIEAGADRLGCSAGVAIVTGGAGTGSY
jgi:deoxyribose-phosphate aldolase